MQQSYGNQSKAKVTGAILAVLVIAGIVLIADHFKSNTTAASTATTTSQTAATDTSTPDSANDTSTSNTSSTATDTTTSASSSAYRDGTYTATSDYYVPHGSEEISVKLTIANGIITDSTVTNSEGDRDSAEYQEDFVASYKSYIVGKSISGLSLSRVAGASDTTQGFNDALSQIADQAQA
jgi:uncharacterized protein with FMN-binding domain